LDGSPLAGRARPGPHGNPLPRIGYLSAHFHKENYMKPVWALLNHHDRSRFEIHLLSDARDDATAFPGYRAHPDDRVHPVGRMSNAELADFIAARRIDVLIDLSSYGAQRRLELFVSPPAPVVAAWFNAYATTGLPGIDFIIGDGETVRPDEEVFYSEKVCRLPVSYLTFEVTHAAPPVVPPPCLAGNGLTFGSLVTQYKILPQVIDAWCAILRGAPASRLALGNSDLKPRENRRWLLESFADRGIDPGRIELLPPAAHFEFLGHYDRIDVALDAFPYNGGTTTMEAIWQGVPVLTFDGDRWASRTSQTLLRRCHLGEFVADSVEDMVARAISLAEDPETPARLAKLRATMRARLAAAPACDGAALARGMEGLFGEWLAASC
jgi:predicted O-linked N-acetylglucosamine transferase (SPINDLY family)